MNFTSTGPNATSWSWNFGDGSTSTDANPVHTFDTVGTYEVCLIASNFCSADTFCQMIEVTCTPIISSFTYTEDGNTVNFTSTTAGATSWKWKFGDGGNTNVENPTYTYADTGTFEVCLIVFNACSSDTLCQNIHVGCTTVVPAFTYTQTGYTLSFNDESGNATSWMWTFGDGGTSNLQNPTYTYATQGTYQVCLVASNNCATDTTCQTITIECPLVNAAFTETVNDLSVSFTDQSANASSWSWSFGDGGTSSAQNPSHTYSAAGTYVVCATIGNGCDSQTVCNEVVVTCPPLNAAFAMTQSNNTVSFNDLTGNATSWNWTFGDDSTSNLQNPVHTYLSNGFYNVCLVVSDSCSSDSTCDSVTILGLGAAGVNVLPVSLSIYPNPITDEATISFDVSVTSEVSVTIADLQGRVIAALINEQMQSGYHSFIFSRGALTNGIYLVQLKQAGELIVKALVIE